MLDTQAPKHIKQTNPQDLKLVKAVPSDFRSTQPLHIMKSEDSNENMSAGQ